MEVVEGVNDMAEIIKEVDFMAIFADVKACVPYLLPACLGFLGLRKAWSFIQSVLVGA